MNVIKQSSCSSTRHCGSTTTSRSRAVRCAASTHRPSEACSSTVQLQQNDERVAAQPHNYQQQQHQHQHQQQHPLPSPLRRASAAALAAAHVLFATAAPLATPPPPAHALLSNPSAQIPRSVDAALRRATPAFNRDVAAVQARVEDIAFLLRIPQRKPWGSMAADVDACLALVRDDRPRLLAGVPDADAAEANALLDRAQERLLQLELAVRTQQPDFAGLRASEVLKLVSRLEVLQAPGLPYSLPRDLQDRPRLVGRAVVRLTFEKADGSLAFVDAKEGGGARRRGAVELTLDGYSAPLSAGNFAANVQDGLYNGRPVAAGGVSVTVAAAPAKERPPVPLEILPAGEFEPLYRLPLDVQSGELPVLPLSIPGAVAMTHASGESDALSSGTEWFIFKFDRQQSGLGGLSFDEGRFGVFAYVTAGIEDVVPRLATGDVLVKAEIVEGANRLVRPAAASAAAASAAAAGSGDGAAASGGDAVVS